MRDPSYEELACELLDKELLPLALPRWPKHESDPIHYPAGLTDRDERELQYQVCLRTDLSPSDWPNVTQEQRIVWMRLALEQKRRDAESPAAIDTTRDPNDRVTLATPTATPGKTKERGDDKAAAKCDDALPKSKRADSPSRIKARSAYDYAMERLCNANSMTASELFDAIKEDGEAAEMLPPTPESFTKYLNDCGIRLKKGGPKSPGGSVVRQSEM